MKAAKQAAIRTVMKVGDTVWFADRRNGRITENIAKVYAVGTDDTLGLAVVDQGQTVLHSGVSQWRDGATHGWWKANNNVR